MTIIGTKGDDVLGSSFGSGPVHGKGGNDILTGGPNADILNGGRGRDTLIGGSGADVLKGGKGRDVFVVNDGDTILDFKPGLDRIVIDQPFEKLLILDGFLYTDFDGNMFPTNPDNLIAVVPGITLEGSDLLNA